MYEERRGDPIRTMKRRVAGGGVGVVGLWYFVALLIHLAPTVRLDRSDPVVEAVGGKDDAWFGVQYQIEVDGTRYWCSGGETKYAPRRNARITYDRTRPEICRAEDVVGSLGNYEIVALLAASSFVAAGLATTVLWNREKAYTIAICICVLLGWSYLLFSFVMHGRPHG